MAQLVERLLCKQDVAGSNPATSTSVWVAEAPPVSGGDARGASPFAFSSWQWAVGSGNLRFMVFDLRLRLAILAFEDLPWRRRPRRRALRGNGLISGRRLADTMARAPSPRVAGGSQFSATAGRRGRVELPLDRKRHGGNGRAGARPSRGDDAPVVVRCAGMD